MPTIKSIVSSSYFFISGIDSGFLSVTELLLSLINIISDALTTVEDLLSKKFVENLKRDDDILAVMLFGSYARGEARKESDIDACIVLKDRIYDKISLSQKEMNYMSLADDEKVQVHIFQNLPIFVRIRVLKEGKISFCKDEDMLYDIAFMTIKEFEAFKKYYKEYLDSILYAR
ncbi:MAG: nucleotidyltransferase domain-containing protein [Nitrososphaerales archaeon]